MSENSTPVEAGHDDASNADKVTGIVEQMRGDLQQGNVTDISEVVRQRLSDAGITATDDEFEAILARLR